MESLVFPQSLKHLLLVEDSPDDVDFARRALAKSGIPHRLTVAEQGEEALELLFGRPNETAALRPTLILLDLNIPGVGGLEVLRQIKANGALRSIPVVMLSTSRHPWDIENCYRAGANSYHYKSDDLATCHTTIRQIVDYWLGACALPTAAPEACAEMVR